MARGQASRLVRCRLTRSKWPQTCPEVVRGAAPQAPTVQGMTDTEHVPTIPRRQRVLEALANALYALADAVEDKALRGRFEPHP